MLPFEVRKYLFDVAQACDLLTQFTRGKAFTDYTADALLRSAVERQFEIIGEALNQALRLYPDLTNHVSDCRRVVAFRNRLIHGYAFVSDESASLTGREPVEPQAPFERVKAITRCRGRACPTRRSAG